MTGGEGLLELEHAVERLAEGADPAEARAVFDRLRCGLAPRGGAGKPAPLREGPGAREGLARYAPIIVKYRDGDTDAAVAAGRAQIATQRREGTRRAPRGPVPRGFSWKTS